MAAQAQKLYWARRPLPGYGRDNKPYDQGEMLKLQGTPNDERMLRLGYIEEFQPPRKTWKPAQCGKCGRKFQSEGFRDQHGRNAHRRRALNPIQEDERAEKQERRLNETAPLYLDRTQAAQRG